MCSKATANTIFLLTNLDICQHLEPVESPMPAMEMDELLLFLRDTPGFKFELQNSEMKQSTDRSNASPPFSQGSLKLVTRRFQYRLGFL